jgi:hypothetical protein
MCLRILFTTFESRIYNILRNERKFSCFAFLDIKSSPQELLQITSKNIVLCNLELTNDVRAHYFSYPRT